MSKTIEELKSINRVKISKLEHTCEEYKVHLVIDQILNSSENCFLKLPMDVSCEILSYLVEPTSVKETYSNLVSYQQYKRNDHLTITTRKKVIDISDFER